MNTDTFFKNRKNKKGTFATLSLMLIMGMLLWSCPDREVVKPDTNLPVNGTNGPGGGSSGITTIGSDANPALYISALGVFFAPEAPFPPYADGDKQWIEITIRDADALPSGWKLNNARENPVVDFNTIIDTSLFTWELQDGDVIRTHPSDWTGDQDTAKSDNNPDKWDFKTDSTFGFDSRSGFVYIIDSSNVIHDVVVYANGNNEISVTGEAQDALTAAVSGGLWPGGDTANAIDIGDTSMNFAQLADSSMHGNAVMGWVKVDPSGNTTPATREGGGGVE